MQATATQKPSKAQKPTGAQRLGVAKKRTAPKALTKSNLQTPSPPQQRTIAPSPASGERHQNEGHGRRLTMAFEALEAFPALAESRDRLLASSPRSTSRQLTWSPRSSPMWRC